ncbi:hypothetical protein AAHA92_03959 [Salvia divinorum]|uniref:Uncharacterized protein n=1 Tax=Salvia divinorum TaxID=28513 RepID=A0ABD1HXM8_SALDI
MEKSLGTYEDRKSDMSYADYMECVDFFKLVRESRGYDIVSYPSFMLESGWLDRTLRPVDRNFELANHHYQENLILKTDIIVSRINFDAKSHGEFYLEKSFVNVVRNIQHELSLVTFTVKQVYSHYNYLGVVKTVQAMVSKARRHDRGYKVEDREYKVEEWRFKPQVIIRSSKSGLFSDSNSDSGGDGDGAGALCIGGGSDKPFGSPMDWE